MDEGYKLCRICKTPTHIPENGLCPGCATMLYDWSKEDILKELTRYRAMLYKRGKGQDTKLQRRKK